MVCVRTVTGFVRQYLAAEYLSLQDSAKETEMVLVFIDAFLFTCKSYLGGAVPSSSLKFKPVRHTI